MKNVTNSLSEQATTSVPRLVIEYWVRWATAIAGLAAILALSWLTVSSFAVSDSSSSNTLLMSVAASVVLVATPYLIGRASRIRSYRTPLGRLALTAMGLVWLVTVISIMLLRFQWFPAAQNLPSWESGSTLDSTLFAMIMSLITGACVSLTGACFFHLGLHRARRSTGSER